MIISDVLGTIVCHQDGTPNTEKFYFVVGGLDLQEHKPVHIGQYVSISTEEGLIIAHVEQVQKTNRYFAQIDAVHDFTRTGKSFSGIFPVDRWEYLLAEAKPLGVFQKGRVQRLTYPPSPGAQVRIPDERILSDFLGFSDQGIHLGDLLFHDIPARFNLTRMFQKHVALLAMSGAGKSYTAAVMIEELLLRKPEEGRPAILILDVHGEYIGLEESHAATEANFEDKITIIRSPLVELATPQLNSVDFARYSPEMSGIQIRELTRIIRTLRKARKGKTYDLDDLIAAVENDPSGNVRTREALLGWLDNLQRLQLFGKTSTPDWSKIMIPGKAVILEMSDTISLRKKQIIAAEVVQQLFYLRRENQIPPTIVIVEEAHQFCPEARRGLALSKSIFETVAREGRKYNLGLALISQRPVRLSTTVLSQCGTNIFLRITNPYDLDHLKSSSEQITKSTLTSISSLSVGEALVVGQGTRFPVFIKIRPRITKETSFGDDFETVAKRFEKE
ncbi:MAG: ATP-binding protein [Promethearchaeota archaeon]